MKPETKKHARCCPLPATCFGYRDATALVEAYISGATNPEEIAEICLESAQSDNHVYISIARERALMEARLATMRYKAGCPLSIFDGVPIGWKDIFFMKGTVTTAGSQLYRDNEPDTQDSELVRFTTRAGTVNVGKLNLSEFAYSSIGYNPHYGTPLNPHGKANEPRDPGGSSSGPAVAVAAGMLPVAIGSDTGGSVRVPAAYNGILGFKPSKKRYSFEGGIPLSRTLDTPGTFARSMRDIVHLDHILRARPFEKSFETRGLAELCRFVIDTEFWEEYTSSEAVQRNFKQAIERLESAGACIIKRRVKPFRDAIARPGWITGAEALAEHELILSDPDCASKIDPFILERTESARLMRPETVVRAYWWRTELTRAIREDLGDAILLSLPIRHVAPSLDLVVANKDIFFEYIRKNSELTRPGNVMDMPGISMPTGVDDEGMPTGLLLSTPSGHDEALLAVACELEGIISGLGD